MLRWYMTALGEMLDFHFNKPLYTVYAFEYASQGGLILDKWIGLLEKNVQETDLQLLGGTIAGGWFFK